MIKCCSEVMNALSRTGYGLIVRFDCGGTHTHTRPTRVLQKQETQITVRRAERGACWHSINLVYETFVWRTQKLVVSTFNHIH